MSIKLKDTIYDLISNADKLDGKDSTAFALSEHTHNYLSSLPDHTHSYASKITVGTTIYNISGNNITIPTYPTLSSLGAAPSNHTHSTYLPLSGGTMTDGNISWNTDSHGIYFYNGCGIEKWNGYPPSLVAETGTDFYISNKLDRKVNYLILHLGNYSNYAATKNHSHSEYFPKSGGTITAASGTYVVNFNSTDGQFCVNSYLINDVRKADIGYLKDDTRAAAYIYNSTGICGLAANDDGEIYKINATNFKLNKIWHSGNHGAGSGLNADLLDGSHGAAFAKTVKIGSTSYNASNSVISLPAYPTIPTSLKNPTSLTIQANGTSLGSYDGSSAKTFNITCSNVGAATSGHNHDSTYLKLIGGSLSGKLTVDTGSSYSISLGTYTSWGGGSYPTIKSSSSDGWIMFLNPHICADDMNNFAKTSCIRMESPGGNPWDITSGNNGAKDFRVSEFRNNSTRSTKLIINEQDSSLGTIGVPGTKHPIIYGNGTYLTLGYTDAVSNSDYGIVIEKNDVRPTTTNTRSLGLSNYIWTNIFSNSCNINYGLFNNSLTVCCALRSVIVSNSNFTWGGESFNYPLIYTQLNTGDKDRYTMIAMPHIPYLKNGSRSYTGNTYGAVVRYESDAISPASYWDCGVISSDVFGIRRETNNYFTIGSDGGVAFRNNKGSIIHINANSTNSADVNSCIEFFSGTAYIDWHYNGDTGDFTTRLIESSKGTLTCNGSFNVSNTLYIGGEAITFTT